MKDYRGIVRISCQQDKCPEGKVSIEAECANCFKGAGAEIIDLENKPLATIDKKKRGSGTDGQKSKLKKKYPEGYREG